MPNSIGLGLSPLTDKIFYGKKIANKMWVGRKKDITDDYLDVLFVYIKEGEVRRILTDKKEHLFIHIANDKVSIEKAIKYLKNIKPNKDETERT